MTVTRGSEKNNLLLSFETTSTAQKTTDEFNNSSIVACELHFIKPLPGNDRKHTHIRHTD